MSNEHAEWLGDRGYHLRHARRSLRRARCIAKYLSEGGSFLDVGCNLGIVTKHLLATGRVASATGIELAPDAVARELLLDPRFQLVQGDVCEAALTECYDNIFYGAVHHHIVRERGLNVAIDVLRKLVRHCNDSVYFETGHISEGGRWGWQNCLREHFRTDEEHLFFLLQSIEPWLRDFAVVGKFYIHGVRRWLLRIEVKCATKSRVDDQTNLATTDAITRPVRLETGGAAVESMSRPSLLSELTGNNYRVERAGQSTAKFFKKRVAMGHIDEDEFHIGSQVERDWAVRPIGVHWSTGIEFPFIAGSHLLNWRGTTAIEREIVCDQVLRIFQEALATEIVPTKRVLLPTPVGISLLQLVDFNPRNWIVVEGANPPIVRVVDFERQSNHYLWKNRIHFARSLFRLRLHRPYAAYQMCLGLLCCVFYLLRYQFVDVRQRIVDRQPSMLSFFLAETRSALGRAVAKLIPSLKER